MSKTAEKTALETAFEREYARLNTAQKLAVDTIEGPVMVVAGPGTGKTQVVALRVANILKKTHMRPSNILCLTFSSSGATAMRERLRSLIGADAYGVTVNTIHGFCNDIITQNPQVFEAWSSLEQISDVERYRSINRIIDQLLPDLVIVNRKSPYQRTRDILSRISQVKREGKTLEELRQVADQYEQEMGSKSKEGTKAHAKNLATARKFHEFVNIFALYQEMLEETQRYDYDDMILNVIRALREEDWLLAQLQERYQYITVDEVQDTNGAQYRMLDVLTTYPTLQSEPNFCIVGDDDQAIYRFQGANLSNILSFHARFPSSKKIVLTISYRCTQNVLDAAGNVIAHNTERLVGRIDGLSKDLQSGKGIAGEQPLLVRTVSDITEPWVVADLVQEALQRGIRSKEIAILTQTNSELIAYHEVLKARAIPTQMNGKLDLLGHPLVKQTVSILKAIQNPSDSAALAAGLSAECFGCHAADLGRLYMLRRELEKPLFDLLLLLDDPAGPLKNIPFHKPAVLLATRDILLGLSQQLPNRTILDTLEHVLKDCRLLPQLQTGDGMQMDLIDFAALQAFFDRIRYRCYEQTTFSFEAFLSDLELYGKDEYGDLKMSYSLPHIVEEGVQLMTAHQSKGLEFEVVILPNFRDGHWDKRHNPSSLAIPEDLLFGWGRDQKSYEQHQDERRVAYVAMTRAKNTLLFTCPRKMTNGDKAKDISPSAFFAEAKNALEVDRDVENPEQISTLLFTPLRSLDDELKAFLRERIANFSLSVTALNHFLEDPQLFLVRDLLQMPDVKDSSLVYGNAVHAALKKWGMSVHDGLPLSGEQFLGEFNNYLVDREVLTDAERKRLLAHGQEQLPRYYDERLSGPFPVVHKIEFPVKAQLDGALQISIPLKGMLDRIDVEHADSAVATIIDYKTGRPQTEKQIKDGDYFRQLVFYSLLLEHGHTLLKPKAFILDFVGEGTDEPIQRIFQISETDKAELRTIVRDVWAKVLNLDFTPL